MVWSNYVAQVRDIGGGPCELCAETESSEHVPESNSVAWLVERCVPAVKQEHPLLLRPVLLVAAATTPIPLRPLRLLVLLQVMIILFVMLLMTQLELESLLLTLHVTPATAGCSYCYQDGYFFESQRQVPLYDEHNADADSP